MAFSASEWHARVKGIFLGDPNYQEWAQTAPFGGRLIPLCTPIPEATRIVVIGKNHAAFDKKDHTKAEEIAESFSQCPPTVSTFIEHNHTFKQGLQRLAKKSDLSIDGTWGGHKSMPDPNWKQDGRS